MSFLRQIYGLLVPSYHFSQRAEKVYKQKFFFQPNLLAKTEKNLLLQQVPSTPTTPIPDPAVADQAIKTEISIKTEDPTKSNPGKCDKRLGIWPSH